MMRNDVSQDLPAVSVVVPFLNAVDTLSECLDSLQAQIMQNFEAVLIDDGSRDSSAELVRERIRTDNRLRLLSPGRIGLDGALNLGIEYSRADAARERQTLASFPILSFPDLIPPAAP